MMFDRIGQVDEMIRLVTYRLRNGRMQMRHVVPWLAGHAGCGEPAAKRIIIAMQGRGLLSIWYDEGAAEGWLELTSTFDDRLAEWYDRHNQVG